MVDSIQQLAKRCYTTVGVVLTEANEGKVNDIVQFAASLGVQDICVIPAAQDGDHLTNFQVDPDVLARLPILAFRIGNLQRGLPVRGIGPDDPHTCALVLDDMAVCEGKHYPCIIYLREGGEPIGEVGPNMRLERAAWVAKHDSYKDPICSANCLDVCVRYNTRWNEMHDYQRFEGSGFKMIDEPTHAIQ